MNFDNQTIFIFIVIVFITWYLFSKKEGFNDEMKKRHNMKLQHDMMVMKNQKENEILNEKLNREHRHLARQKRDTMKVGVIIFEHPNSGGLSAKLRAGEYDPVDLEKLGFRRNTISSITVRPGYRAILLGERQPGQREESREIGIRPNGQVTQINLVDLGWDDKVHGIIVIPYCPFDAGRYEAMYPDLKAAFNGNVQALANHYNTYGMREGRSPCGISYEIKEVLYPGNNGTVSGDTYCTGGWGSVDGKTAKNMDCVRQLDAITGEALECGRSYATHAGLRPTNVYCT
jgi:hypothetical protein